MIEWEIIEDNLFLRVCGAPFHRCANLCLYATLDEAKLAVLHAAKQHLAEMLEAVKGELGE